MLCYGYAHFVRGVSISTTVKLSAMGLKIFFVVFARSLKHGVRRGDEAIYTDAACYAPAVYYRLPHPAARFAPQSSQRHLVSYEDTFSTMFVVEKPGKNGNISTRPPLAITAFAPAICSTV